MDNRVFQSLPTLQISKNIPKLRQRTRPSRATKFQKPENEALTMILSAFYAKVLIIFGIALPVTEAITTHDYKKSYDKYYLYLYAGGILFLFYMYAVQYKEKSIQENWRLSTSYRFGISSMIYSALKFAQYFEMTAECRDMIKAVIPASKIVFVLLQILFIFSYSNYLDIQKSKIISRFGLMHMLATNINEWLLLIVKETQHDIYQSFSTNSNNTIPRTDRSLVDSKTSQIALRIFMQEQECYMPYIFSSVLKKTAVYLLPFTIEYNILSSVIVVLMWKNIMWDSSESDRKKILEVTSRPSEASGTKSVYLRSQSQFSVDCAKAHKGLFGGIFLLAATIVSLILFFEMVTHKDMKDIAILQVSIWETVLFWIGTIACFFCLIALRGVDFSKNKRDLELEHMLIVVTQLGVYMYFLFQVIGGILMGIGSGNMMGATMRIVTPLSAIIQSSCQTALILDTWKRRCVSDEEIKNKPGRQLVTFLLIINISLWLVNRLKNNRSVSHPFQMDFYGILAWNIITHVTMPFVVSYRFQSTLCFCEIWKHVYKMRPVKSLRATQPPNCHFDQNRS